MMDLTKNIYHQYMYSYPHKTAYRSLKNIDLRAYLDKLQKREDTLYFHVPFCETKCGYCNLFSVTGMKENDYERYIEAMRRQCEQYALKEDVSFQSLVLGGGTPLILTIEQLEQIFDLSKTYCHTDVAHAFTVVETSPNQTTKEKLSFLKSKGVNRMSIGVQSFHQHELNSLYRMHTPSSARKAIEAIKEVNFEVMNIDLIYGIPNQTMDSLRYSLELAVSYMPEEIFIYPLYVQPHTLLHKKGITPHPDAYKMYGFIGAYLQKEGYHQTSMRRFTRQQKPQAISCSFEKTLAIGCGGRTYIDDLHFCSPYAREQKNCRKIIDDYIQIQDFMEIKQGYLMNQAEQKNRFVIKNLLYYKGIDLKIYKQQFTSDCETDFPCFKILKSEGYVVEKDDCLRLTALGLGLSDAIGPSFISETVANKMAAWEETVGERI